MHHSEVVPQSPSRRRARAVRTEEILAAAQAMVLTQGVEALTVHALAKALNFVPAALYRYFPSKEALLAALIARAVQGLGRTLQATQAHLAGASHRDKRVLALARVLLLVETYLEWARLAPHELALVNLATADPRVLVPQAALVSGVALQLAPTVGLVLEQLETAGRVGALDDTQAAPVRALLLFSAVHGALTLRKLTRLAPGVVDLDGLARTQAHVLLRGFGATPARIEAADGLVKPLRTHSLKPSSRGEP